MKRNDEMPSMVEAVPKAKMVMFHFTRGNISVPVLVVIVFTQRL